MAFHSGMAMAVSGKTDSPFTKPVAVLVNENTESEPEIFTAIMKEYKRVSVFGSTTRGAFNGSTEGTGLSFKAGMLAIPIDRTVTALETSMKAGALPPIRLSQIRNRTSLQVGMPCWMPQLRTYEGAATESAKSARQRSASREDSEWKNAAGAKTRPGMQVPPVAVLLASPSVACTQICLDVRKSS